MIQTFCLRIALLSVLVLPCSIARLYAAATPAQKTAPHAPPNVEVRLLANPTVADIRSVHVFREPLLPVGGVPTTAENNALAGALIAFSRRGDGDDISAFDAYLRAHADSPWIVSLQTNLGLHCYARGLYSSAIVAWEAAWEKGKSATLQREKVVPDRQHRVHCRCRITSGLKLLQHQGSEARLFSNGPRSLERFRNLCGSDPCGVIGFSSELR